MVVLDNDIKSQDERIRKELTEFLKKASGGFLDTTTRCKTFGKWFAWLEKQGKKTNPYSGISFEYNGHIWGMCARDNGVDILLDKHLIGHLGNEQITANSAKTCNGRQNTAWSEKDEKMYRGLHNLIYATPYCNSRQEFSDWLETFKQRYNEQRR